MNRAYLLTAFVAATTACSGTSSAPRGTPPNVDAGAGAAISGQDETWADGKTLTSNVVVPPGATVTIAPGATITASAGVSIIVEGTLRSRGGAPHAKIEGSAWSGILVAGSGTLALDGVDLSGADAAIHVQSGNAVASYDRGTISLAMNPFFIEAGGSLSTSHAVVVSPRGKTRVAGSLTASYLSYDSNDNFGIYAESPSAIVKIDDSTFKNSGPKGSAGGHDILNAFGAALLHVAYTDISGAHCGFHIEQITTLELDHVTVHDVTNGADLWGSSVAGKSTITSSNFEKSSVGFDEGDLVAPVLVSGCFIGEKNNLVGTKIQITGAVTQRIPDAKPR